MEKQLRIKAEILDKTTGQVVEMEELTVVDIQSPTSVVDFGLNQQTQLDLLTKTQSKLLQEQAWLLDVRPEACPQCGAKVSKNGKQPSVFHHVYSEHRIFLQKWVCSSTRCEWSETPSIGQKLGGSLHVDLIRIQAVEGATNSFGKGVNVLAETLGHDRSINNRNRISRTTREVGAAVEQRLQTSLSSTLAAAELIIEVDGGHVHDWERSGHDFEAMVAKVFRPENRVEVSPNRVEIVEKACAASAKADAQETMQTLAYAAAQQQGLSPQTTLTALADGARNCWNILEFFQGSCAVLLCILDWLHLNKNLHRLFQKVSHFSSEEQMLIHTALWTGQVNAALRALEAAALRIAQQLGSLQFQQDIQDFIRYLKNNQAYIVNYQQRQEAGLIYTSSIAESTVEHLLNPRFKKKQKMQWSRKATHALLQIRSAMASQRWNAIWQEIVQENFAHQVA
jgi:hypothetical protein